MSHILAQWINQEIGLSRNVLPQDLDELCANGYVLGELLHKYDLQDNFVTAFSKADNPEAAVKNFALLERTLRDKLGISLSSNFAFDLIKCRTGCAAKLLYVYTAVPLRLGNLSSWLMHQTLKIPDQKSSGFTYIRVYSRKSPPTISPT